MFFVNEMGIVEEAKLRLRMEQTPRRKKEAKTKSLSELKKMIREAKDNRYVAIAFIQEYQNKSSLTSSNKLSRDIALIIEMLKKIHNYTPQIIKEKYERVSRTFNHPTR